MFDCFRRGIGALCTAKERFSIISSGVKSPRNIDFHLIESILDWSTRRARKGIMPINIR